MMKYIYGSMASIGILVGISMLFVGTPINAILTLILGAVCMVAAEVSELSEKLKKEK